MQTAVNGFVHFCLFYFAQIQEILFFHIRLIDTAEAVTLFNTLLNVFFCKGYITAFLIKRIEINIVCSLTQFYRFLILTDSIVFTVRFLVSISQVGVPLRVGVGCRTQTFFNLLCHFLRHCLAV